MTTPISNQSPDLESIDTLCAYRNTCTVSYWREGWHTAARLAGVTITIDAKDNDLPLPFGQVHPLGSGHGGRVRSGDEMRPTEYTVRCASDDAKRLRDAHASYIARLLA